MEMQLKTIITKGLVSRFLQKKLKKSLKLKDPTVHIYDLSVDRKLTQTDTARIVVNVNASMELTYDDLTRLMNNVL